MILKKRKSSLLILALSVLIIFSIIPIFVAAVEDNSKETFDFWLAGQEEAWNASRKNTLEELLKSTEVVLEVNVAGLLYKELEKLRSTMEA